MMPRLRSSKTNCAVPNRRMGIEARLRNTIALACFSCKRLVLRFGCYLRVYVCSAAGVVRIAWYCRRSCTQNVVGVAGVRWLRGRVGFVPSLVDLPPDVYRSRSTHCCGRAVPSPVPTSHMARAHGTAVVLDRNTACYSCTYTALHTAARDVAVTYL